MKNLKTLTLACLVFFGSSTLSFAEESAQLSQNSELSLKSYFEASLQKDYETLSALSEDQRYSSLEEKKQEYKSSLQDPSEVPLTYAIIDQKKVNDEKYNYTVKVEFADQEVINLPISMQYINGGWKVLITSDPVNVQEKYEIIKQAEEKQMLQKEKDQVFSSAQSSTKCTWNFSERVDGRSFTSLCNKFDLSTKNYRVSLNLQQYNDHNDNIVPLIKYEIFETKFFGDNLWGYTDVYGVKKGKGYQTEIFGDTLKATNCYIRFTIESSTNTVTTFKGFGELYSY